MAFQVVYNGPVVNRICGEDGRWLVTSHERRLVKAQRVVAESDVDAGDAEGSDAPGEFARFRNVPDQAGILDRVLSINAQWLVTVAGGALVAAERVECPVTVPAPVAKAEPVPVTKGRRKVDDGAALPSA